MVVLVVVVVVVVVSNKGDDRTCKLPAKNIHASRLKFSPVLERKRNKYKDGTILLERRTLYRNVSNRIGVDRTFMVF